MGLLKFIDKARLSNIYEARLRSLGLEPRAISPSFHAHVCTAAEEYAREVCDGLRMTGQPRIDHFHQAMLDAADLVVLGNVGPTKFGTLAHRDANEVILDAAADWFRGGRNHSDKTKIVAALQDMNALNKEFASAMSAEFDRLRAAPQ